MKTEDYEATLLTDILLCLGQNALILWDRAAESAPGWGRLHFDREGNRRAVMISDEAYSFARYFAEWVGDDKAGTWVVRRFRGPEDFEDVEAFGDRVALVARALTF